MRLSFKVLIGLWIGLFAIIGGLLFNAYSNLKPETFIALLTEQVQKNYPGAKLEVGKIDYRFSLDFNLNLQNIHLRRSGKLLASIGKVELKVPWWLLVINRGNAQINLSKLDIYIDHHEEHAIKTKSASTSSSLIQVKLPNYLADARYTLRAKEVSIRDIHNERRYFTLSKLLVREFQYGKNSAFELNIPIEITHNEARYKSELWLFGDITPETSEWNLNYRGEFRTLETNDRFQIEDMVIAGTAAFRPTALDIQSQIALEIDRATVGKGTLTANQDKLAVQFNFDQIPVNYFNFIYDEIKNPYLIKLEGTGVGALKFEKEFNTELASVSGKLGFDGNLKVSDASDFAGKWQLGFQDGRWEVSFITPKGEVSFFRRAAVDMKKNTLTQYNEELGFTGLDLTHVVGAIRPLSQFIKETPPTYYHSVISFKKCVAGEKIFDGNFHYGSTPDQKFYQADLTEETQSFKLKYAFKNAQHQIDANFSKFQWLPQFNFLDPFFKAQSALLDGKVEGRWGEESWENGEWLIQTNASQLSEAQGLIPDLIQKTLATFEINPKNFQEQALHVSVRNKVINLHSLSLEKGDSGKITGQLSTQPKQKSFLTLSYPKNKKWKPVKKDVLEIYWKEKEQL